MRGDREVGYANNWLNAIPSEALGLKMSKASFSTSLKWIMGDAMCPPQGCPERTITNKQCNKPLDPWGDHAVTCPTGPSRIARHDLLNITWLASLKTAGFHARAEVKVDPDTQRRAADTFVYNWNNGSPAAHDWKVTHLLRAGMEKNPLDPNWAVREGESAKTRADHGECAKQGVDFDPLVVDTMGGFGQHAIKAISKVANHCRIMGDDDASLKRKRLAQKLRFVTMKGIATQILRRNVVNPEIHTVEKLDEEVSHAISATHTEVSGTDVGAPLFPLFRTRRPSEQDEGEESEDQGVSDSPARSEASDPRRKSVSRSVSLASERFSFPRYAPGMLLPQCPRPSCPPSPFPRFPVFGGHDSDGFFFHSSTPVMLCYPGGLSRRLQAY